MKIIAITGGIGTGKSVVSCILRVMGYPVYDCDSEAKRLMTTDQALVSGIKQLLGDDAYLPDRSLNREYVASRIFADSTLIASMNSLVHPAVLTDIQRWARATGCELAFVETALLRESNMTSIIDKVWTVIAPLETRIERVARRSSLTEEQTRNRIANQSNELIESASVILNDNIVPVLPQILRLLSMEKIGQ